MVPWLKELQKRLLDLINEGKFGDVYRVIHEGRIYALKSEGRDISDSRLKTEVLVYKSIEEESYRNPQLTAHFLRMLDRGLDSEIKYVVISYYEQNLVDVRLRLKREFSYSTALRVCIQLCEAVDDLHKLGFVHCESLIFYKHSFPYLKPQHFVVGRFHDRNLIYLVDFELAVRDEATADPKTNRISSYKTLRYVSRRIHKGISKPTVVDDYESLIYVCLEAFDMKILPWSHLTFKNVNEMVKSKENFFHHQYPEVYIVCPPEFKQIVNLVNTPNTTVKIPKLLEILHAIRIRKRIDLFALYEWEALGSLDSQTIVQLRTTQMTNEAIGALNIKQKRSAQRLITAKSESNEAKEKQKSLGATAVELNSKDEIIEETPIRFSHSVVSEQRSNDTRSITSKSLQNEIVHDLRSFRK
ncbi:Serine threonine protein kinase-related domain containing protein [Aphelenchoides besseyi]|nr:Serine threonine protein kinase-related domain containing protein [Aphelenchoides besseyi]